MSKVGHKSQISIQMFEIQTSYHIFSAADQYQNDSSDVKKCTVTLRLNVG